MPTASADAVQDATKIGRRRYVIGLLLLSVITIAYVDRIVMSVAGPQIAAEFKISSFVKGLVFSAFFWGYATTMLPGGWLIDRGGKHIVLPIAVFIWTIVSISTGFVRSLAALFMVRILLGVGEAPAYPCGNLTIREWSPLRERGFFTSLMQTGSLLGPGLASAPAAYLVEHHGWRPSFFALSSLGFIWLIAWLTIYRKPQNARWITDAERQHILSTRNRDIVADAPASSPMSIPLLLKQRPMIGILLANGPQTYSLYFLLTWLPSYLTSGERGFDLMNSGLLTSAMYLLAMLAAICLAWGSDRWLQLSQSQAQRGTRRHIVALAMLIGVVTVLMTPWIHNRYALVATVAVTLTMITIAITLTYALTNDLIVDDASAGRTFAMVSFSGQVMGLMAPIVTGWIVGFASYKFVFIVTASLLLLGAASAWTLPRRQLQPFLQR